MFETFFSFNLLIWLGAFGITGLVVKRILSILAAPNYFPGSKQSHPDQTKPRILLICLTGPALGGTETHAIKLYKMLINNNYHVSILVNVNTKIEQSLKEEGLSFYSTQAACFLSSFRPLFHYILFRNLKHICLKEKMTIIHCGNRTELNDAKKVKKQLSIHVICSRLISDHDRKISQYQKLDALIGITPAITTYFKKENESKQLGIKKFSIIPPFVNSEKFLNYSTKKNRKTFFKKNFNIDVTDDPVICTLANFYTDLNHKNHPLLLQAVQILIHKKNKPIQLMLAGEGPRQEYLQDLTKKLNIDKFVHFLGFVKHTEELIYHSDINVLPSKNEAFGIVLLEGALMKKPQIGAQDTGMVNIIDHEQTGLLFKNNDLDDLVYQIERLLDDPEFAQQLGENAYNYIKTHFSPEIIFKKHEEVYTELASSQTVAENHVGQRYP